MFPVSLGRPWETGAELDHGLKLGKLQRSLNMLVSGVRALLLVETGALGASVSVAQACFSNLELH